MTTTCMISRLGTVRLAVAAGLLLATIGLGGCDLLDVTDPTRVEEQDLSNATGADLMRRRVLYSFFLAESNTAWYGGLLTDEFLSSPSQFSLGSWENDHRFPSGPIWFSSGRNPYQDDLVPLRHQATLALRQVKAYALESRRAAHMGQMLAVRGYATLRLGEDYCPGLPLHELDGFDPVFGPPLTTAQVFERALADLDSALVLAADSARILDFARVVRGRTLLNLGRFADAAAAVAGVPPGYVYTNESGGSGNLIFNSTFSGESVADREGGNGLDFVSANDPRLETTQYGVGGDGVTELYGIDKYGADGTVPMVVASGLEARLIEAEAALAAGDGAWLDILNDLRATQISPPMEALADPGSADARVDLLFRERAFWLFATGHRLADLRRLVRDYGRSSEAVFPTGADYGTATSLPFPGIETEQQFSPDVDGCTSL